MDYNNEEYINELVDNYKETGSIKKRDKLLDCFKPFFLKYASLLCGHKAINVKNKDTHRFLRLFMHPEERGEGDVSPVKVCAKYVHYVRKLFEDFTLDDIYNEIVKMFLEFLEKYKPMIADHKRTRERISFTHYIQVNMRFGLCNLAKIKSKDALTTRNVLEYSDSIYHPGKESNINSVDYKEINLRWIHGYTTGELFKELSKIERYLVWLKYESDPDRKILSTREVAKLTGWHKKTIDYRLKKIRAKLERFI